MGKSDIYGGFSSATGKYVWLPEVNDGITDHLLYRSFICQVIEIIVEWYLVYNDQ